MNAAAAAAKWPPSAAWRETISRLWKRRGQRPWTPQEDVLVGSDRNEVVAVRIGRSAMAVELRRIALGIPGRLTPLDGLVIDGLRVQQGWDRRELSKRAEVN